MNKTNQFIMFGCWNSLNLDNGLEQTMDTLTNHIRANPVDFIAVAGDNYYPGKEKEKKKEKEKDKESKKEKEKDKESKKEKEKEKEKDKGKEGKTKKINPGNLLRGFDLLPKNVPIKMILGNHDLETNIPSKMELRIEDEIEEPGACSILSLERSFVASNPNIQFGLMNSIFVNNTLVLMLDTSIYDPDDAESFLACYQKQLNDENVSVASIVLKQHHFINTEIARHPRSPNLIIIGHHPITAIKNKGGKERLIEPFPLFITELKKLGEFPHLKNITYLCADLHLYQCGIVTIFGHERPHLLNHYGSSATDDSETIPNNVIIRQYVVGSGGTALDPPINPGAKPENEYASRLEYQLLENLPYSHGFLRCNCRGVAPIFEFIRSNASVMGLGTKRKKQKKSKRKGSKKRRKSQTNTR